MREIIKSRNIRGADTV